MNWNLTGHEWAVRLLQQHLAAGAMRHAYLFTGPAGVGRRTLALRFAQAINCTQPPATGQPCGVCRMCKQIENMQQADLSVVQAGQEGAILNVDAIRELQHRLSLSPYEARFRVALLMRFQEANDNAQNALLKTLEEAPERAILLLTADSAEVLLPTISSRCEILRLRPLPVDEVQASLEARGLSPEQANLLAHISGGRPGYALRLAHDPALLKQRAGWLDDLWELLGDNRRKRFAYAADKARSTRNTRQERDELREELRSEFLTWLSLWRDVLLRAGGSSAPLANPDQQERIERLVQVVDLRAARRLVSSLEEALPLLNKANLQLLVESLMLDLPAVRG